MEEKKILWIVLSMSAFILLIFGAAIYLHSSSKNNGFASSDAESLNLFQNSDEITSVDPDMWTRDPDKIPGYSGDNEIITGNTNVTTNITLVKGSGNSYEGKNDDSSSIDVSGLTEEDKSAEKTLPAELAKQIIPENETAERERVEIKAPEKRIVKKMPEKKQPVRKAESGVSQHKGSLAKTPPASASKNQTLPAKPKFEARKDFARESSGTVNRKPSQPKQTAKPAKAASNKQSYKSVVETIYWVQTASLSSRLNAEKVRDKLLERHMKAEIFTKETATGLTHRVRVGPFKNNTEAEYWLKNIKEIKGFEGSYISQERIRR